MYLRRPEYLLTMTSGLLHSAFTVTVTVTGILRMPVELLRMM